MKKILSYLLLSVLFVVNAVSAESETLIKIHDREISQDEFLRIYNKNNNNNTIDNKSIDEYLQLFINFKLKVIEAEELGYDTLSSFINEFEQYRKQLVKPYFIDKAAEKSLIEEAYERFKQEIKVSHILFRVTENASPEDTLKAYEKAMEVRKQILGGGDFGDLAKATSDDPSAKTNNGTLGYFTVFTMVYPFESAAYKLQVGEISMPVRTAYGYHLIRVDDKRPNQGEVKVAHIMKMTPTGMPQQKIDSLGKVMDGIYESIKAGEDFAELAKNLSEDKQTGVNGGELPWFKSTDRIIKEFLDECFKLEKDGDFSKPFRSPYGWHIVKRLDHRGLKPFEELEDDITQKIKNDPLRNKISEQTAVEKLKKEYDFSKNEVSLTYFKDAAVVTDAIFKKAWKASNCKSNEMLFTLDGKKYTQKDFANFLEETQKESKPYDISVFVENKFNDFVKQTVLDYEESRLDEKYPDYKYLVQEYHDGILLFNLNDEMVWSKAVEDSAGLAQFYQEHTSDYMWGERVKATIYQSADEAKIKKVRKLVKKGNKENKAIEMVCDTLNPNCVTFKTDVFAKGEDEVIDGLAKKVGVTKPIAGESNFYVVEISEIVPEQVKKFEEATGLITSDYQNFLDEQWIESLREKYEIEINKDLLSTIKQND